MYGLLFSRVFFFPQKLCNFTHSGLEQGVTGPWRGGGVCVGRGGGGQMCKWGRSADHTYNHKNIKAYSVNQPWEQGHPQARLVTFI